MKVIIFNLIFLIFSFKNIQSIDEWFGQKWLNENYLFKWKTNHLEKVITIRVEVMTKGWVGFGLSKHGKFNEVDMAIGWVDDWGKSTLKDYWIDKLGNHSLDMSQDWTLILGEENATHTSLEFKRSYLTNDELNDIEIFENNIEMSNIFFGYSFMDPDINENIPEPIVERIFHLNFFEISEIFNESGIQIVNHWLNVSLTPQMEATQCALFKKDLSSKDQVIKYQVIAQPSFEEMKIHQHFAWYDCEKSTVKDEYIGTIFPCYDIKNKLYSNRQKCTSLKLMSILNTLPTIFPDDVGMTISQEESPYFLLEGHLKNPTNKSIDVKLAFRIWLTKQKRKFEASLRAFTSASGFVYDTWGFIVPPKQTNFKIASIASTYCLENDHFDDNGIFIFQLFFHSHHAKKIDIRHYRNDKLVRMISNNNYDDEFQPYRKLNNPINLLKTDKILTICHYNSMKETKGYTAPHEHCLMSSYYYPASTNLDEKASTSRITYENMLKITGLEMIDGYGLEVMDNIIIKKPVEYNNTKLIDFISENKYKMNDPKELEEFQISSDMMECCFVTNMTYAKIKPCRKISKPPGLYQSIIRY